MSLPEDSKQQLRQFMIRVRICPENELFYRDRILWSKSKSLDTTMKRSAKKYYLGMSDILRNKRISSKRATSELVYAVTKK
jgi:hypothetical protein